MKTALIFPGQGSQAVGMGKDLYENFSCAREVFKKTDDILKVNLSKIMFEGPSEELTKTENTQPALMAVSIAIIEVLEKEFGKKISDLASLVAGHSL
jgi:[acyl-carrier-protein] S-malonyltransferase